MKAEKILIFISVIVILVFISHISFAKICVNPCKTRSCSDPCNSLKDDIKKYSNKLVQDKCNDNLNDLQKAVVQLIKIKAEESLTSKEKFTEDPISKFSQKVLHCNEVKNDIPNSGNKYFCGEGFYCAAFAFETAQFFGNNIKTPGNAWELYANNPNLRKWQAYKENIDKQYGQISRKIFRGRWSEKNIPPNGKFPYDKLKTGDIVTVAISIRGYASHAGVVIKDPIDCSKIYILDDIEGGIGTVYIDKYGNYVGERPIIEVIGNK